MRMSILVVEDDPVSRLLLATTLRKLGHEVTETADGLAAWTAFERAPFRVVISDWMMPEMDGLELCRRVPGGAQPALHLHPDADGARRPGELLRGDGRGGRRFPHQAARRQRAARAPPGRRAALELQAEVKQLEGLLPICSYCKKIRDEANAGLRMESFIERQTDAHFSHGICPDCTAKVMANLRRDRPAAR